ncbi:nucleoside diphosphate-linked moiety X motif 19 [Phthorimaea operculella]|nr:nucleoside diphosphate-linked moiety X motif 19 [Phthorimaea operculella]
MTSLVAKSCRNAASLVVLNPRRVAVDRDRCNYEVLLQTRGQGASFRNSVVFPGGVHEPVDSSADWLHLLKSFGFTQSDFDRLHRAGTPVTPIFEDNPVLRHIALRITAIRETFEELGLLICSRNQKKDRTGFWASTIKDFDVKHWQSLVSKDPSELLNLCSNLGCYPDIWALHYWSNWLTPANLKKRFDTAFFLTALQTRPEVEASSEVVKAEWASPSEVIARSKELVIYPPQIYELERFSHWTDLEELVAVAQDTSDLADEIFYHATVIAADGKVFVFYGDDLYPSTVDYNTNTTIKTNKSISELRESRSSIHCIESTNSEYRIVLKNFKPKNIDMGDKVVPLHVTFSSLH